MNNIYDCKILIVDDEKELRIMIEKILRQEGFQRIYTASNCEQARMQAIAQNPNVYLLDVMLPDGDGFSLMKEIRENSMAPVVFLSARDEDENRLLGLGLGADDYITKPFLPRELLLRLCAVLKRTYFPVAMQKKEKKLLELGDTTVDFDSGIVLSKEGEQVLTAKEYALLHKLFENRGNIVTIDALCQAAWDDNIFGYENTLMVHIRRLRAKIEKDPSHPEYLLTVRGLGYKLAKGENK
jgi:DNA-binding response OmpR family regulator